jgi:hypothetical protein
VTPTTPAEPAPAWGTPDGSGSNNDSEARDCITLFTVVGFYAEDGARFRFTVAAATAREAEDLVVTSIADTAADPEVCAVLAVVGGEIRGMDTYAYYLDPNIPSPED